MSSKDRYISELYEEHYLILKNICRKEVNGDAAFFDLIDDCIQDTFMLAYQNIEKIRTHENIRGWLIRTCLNRLRPYAINLRRQLYRNAYSIDDPDAPQTPDEGASIEKAELKEEVRQKLHCLYSVLTPTERRVFMDYFILHHSIEQVAQLRKGSVTSTKSVIRQIRRKAAKLKLEQDISS